MSTIYETLQAAVETLAINTALDIRLGYIGNMERWGDDRQWRVWVNGIYRTDNNNTLGIGGWETRNLDRLLAEVEKGRVQSAILRAVNSDAYGFRPVNDVWGKPVMEASEVEALARRVADEVIADALEEFGGNR